MLPTLYSLCSSLGQFSGSLGCASPEPWSASGSSLPYSQRDCGTGTLEAPHFLTYRRLRVGGGCCSEAGYSLILLSPSLHKVLNLNWQSHSRLRRPPRNTRTISVAGFETSGALTVPFTSKASDFRVAQTYPKDSVCILKMTKEVLCLTFLFLLNKTRRDEGT